MRGGSILNLVSWKVFLIWQLIDFSLPQSRFSILSDLGSFSLRLVSCSLLLFNTPLMVSKSTSSKILPLLKLADVWESLNMPLDLWAGLLTDFIIHKLASTISKIYIITDCGKACEKSLGSTCNYLLIDESGPNGLESTEAMFRILTVPHPRAVIKLCLDSDSISPFDAHKAVFFAKMVWQQVCLW